ALPLRLRVASSFSYFRKSDDFGFGSCTARTATAGRVGWTRGILSGLRGDEFVEVGVGVHAARALLTVADDDIAELARVDVAVDCLDRATELGGGLRCGLKPIG